MGEDLSTGVKIGVTLVILCSIIGTVMALLAVVKNVTREGAMSLQSSLEAMDRMYESNFNQKTITGNEVISALQLNQGSDTAIVVAEPNDDGSYTAYNYGALLGAISTGSAASLNIGTAQLTPKNFIYFDNSTQCYVADYYLVGTQVQYNTNVSNVYKNTEKQYVNPNYKYDSKLIKDVSGTTIGFFLIHSYS